MKILVDDNMSYAQMLFGRLGDVLAVNGRMITASALIQADAVMVRSVTYVDGTLLGGSQVKFVGTATSGTDHVDKDWLVNAGIAFQAAPGCNAIAVVEYVFSALLLLAQRYSFSLLDMTIGIIGVGKVGGCLQQRLTSFGVRTILCDPPRAEAGDSGDWWPLEKLVTKADILTFHTPLTYTGRHATWHLIDEYFLASLPDGSIIINTCRGAVIDNAALLQTFKRGKILHVVLDVWEHEPMILLPLLSFVDIGTFHIAGYTLEGRARGTTQVFNAYSVFIGSDEYATLEELLPPAIVERIRLRGAIDEEALRLLAHLVYDVRRDDMLLRCTNGLPSTFDHLRKNYYQRREWSSLIVETDDSDSANKLRWLGFQGIPVTN